jgi:hypothetical protein
MRVINILLIVLTSCVLLCESAISTYKRCHWKNENDPNLSRQCKSFFERERKYKEGVERGLLLKKKCSIHPFNDKEHYHPTESVCRAYFSATKQDDFVSESLMTKPSKAQVKTFLHLFQTTIYNNRNYRWSFRENCGFFSCTLFPVEVPSDEEFETFLSKNCNYFYKIGYETNKAKKQGDIIGFLVLVVFVLGFKFFFKR